MVKIYLAPVDVSGLDHAESERDLGRKEFEHLDKWIMRERHILLHPGYDRLERKARLRTSVQHCAYLEDDG